MPGWLCVLSVMKKSLTGAVLRKALQKNGSLSALSRELGIRRQAVQNWNKVPAERVIAVEKVTGIPRHVLRPDLYPTEDFPGSRP